MTETVVFQSDEEQKQCADALRAENESRSGPSSPPSAPAPSSIEGVVLALHAQVIHLQALAVSIETLANAIDKLVGHNSDLIEAIAAAQAAEDEDEYHDLLGRKAR